MRSSVADGGQDYFEFKPLTEQDLPLLYSWINQPAVAQWWEDVGVDWHTFKGKYLNKCNSGFEFPFIVHAAESPFGYIEYYEARSVGNGWWPDQQDDGVYGIDVFIGDASSLGHGYGTLFIRRFVENLFSLDYVKKIIIDPAVTNLRAIRCYEKVGFVAVGVQNTPLGKALVMEILSPSLTTDEIQVIEDHELRHI